MPSLAIRARTTSNATRLLLPLVLVAPLGTGCATWPEVDDAQWVRSVGAPRVRQVRDLGTRRPPPPGQHLQGEADGVASPGEYLLIEGWGFGKSPAVSVDGRSAEVVARTENAGIVARVPPNVGVGKRPVEVAVGDSKSSLPFPLRRLVATLHGGVLRAFAIDGETLTEVGKPLALRGARSLVMNADGSCAYVLAGAKVLVIDLGAAGGPKWIAQRDVAIAATALVAAGLGARFVAVADGAVQVFETSDPRAPAPYQPTPLPEDCKGMVRADVDAAGSKLAALVPEGNRVAVVDLLKPAKPRLLGVASVLPEARVPLVRDLRFSPDGESVWVMSGDGPNSLAVGTQPTRLSVVRVARPEGATEGDPQVEAWRIAQLPSAWPPVRLTGLRALPVASGAAVRLPPERTQVRFTSVPGMLLAPGAAAKAEELAGAVEQADATGDTLRAAEPKLILGASYATPESVSLVATGVRAQGGKHEWGLLVVTFTKPPTSSFTPVMAALPKDTTPPFELGDISVQP